MTVLEKHETPGGRARQLRAEGFTFDMGPSWYWMPDVFEKYFSSFGKKVSDYYSLTRLDPSYRVFWESDYSDIPAKLSQLSDLFESWEPGAAAKLNRFLTEAAAKYRTGMQNLVYKPGLSVFEFANAETLGGLIKLDVFTSIKKHIAAFFRDARIRQILEFPVLFLGALPENTPALYSLMNYADIVGGTWYPDGGMYSVVNGMYRLALEQGVKFQFGVEATGFKYADNTIAAVETTAGLYNTHTVVAAADYHFVEQHLLKPEYRSYTVRYWNSRELSPSCVIFYVGLNKQLKNVQHHNLFFDVPFDRHASEIYSSRTWPDEPLFYLCVTSKTDNNVAPPGCENLFFLMPVAAGLEGDTDEVRERYFKVMISRLEQHTGEQIQEHVVYKKSFAYSDFVNEYHSFRGNAYGLANTLRQTALLKPRCRSSKIRNLFYAGQLTVPGPGVPPSLISGEIAATVANRYLSNKYGHQLIS